MGANAISRPQTQPDPVRNLSQIKAPRSTQPDGNRLPRTAKTSLTRKRSLVQIQYGPRGFSKTRLARKASMGASHLRVCPIGAGHRTDVLVSAGGVLAVLVSSGPLSRRLNRQCGHVALPAVLQSGG